MVKVQQRFALKKIMTSTIETENKATLLTAETNTSHEHSVNFHLFIVSWTAHLQRLWFRQPQIFHSGDWRLIHLSLAET